MQDLTFAPSQYNRFPFLDSCDERIIYYLLSPNNKTAEALEATHKIWKLLFYEDIHALNRPLPDYKDVIKLICNDNITQTDYRIFRSPHFSSAWTQQNMLLKVYVDQILPTDRYKAVVNFGVDIVCNSQIINVHTQLYKWKMGLSDKDKEFIAANNLPNLQDEEGYYLFAPVIVDDEGNYIFAEGEDEDVVHVHPIVAPIDHVDGEPIYPQTQSRVATMAQAVLCVLNGANVNGVGLLEFSMEMSRFNQANYSI